ncbi:hypothetical protein DFH09DRAFT_1103839 [Mycena vulgaris]|nr:hypothetical protein DFH09DRAFT_1103839 [Mycena vulgaris]
MCAQVKFVPVTSSLWLRDKKQAFTTVVDEQYNPLERFDTDAGKMQVQLVELREVLPQALRSKMAEMEKNGLADEFRAGMCDQRSNISHRVRRTAGPAIFDCSDEDLMSSASRMKDELRRQIGWTTDKKYDPWVVEILHKDFRGEFDIDTIFLNPKLHLVFAALIRGPSAVPLLKAGKPPIVHAETNDQIWGLQHTTPGAIATSAIAASARFGLSADDSLRENGTVTGINWAADHELYVKYLTTGLEKRKASVFNIFRVWDDIFFPGRGAGLGGRADNGEGGSVVDVMAALNADADVEKTAGGDGPAAGGEEPANDEHEAGGGHGEADAGGGGGRRRQRKN